MIECHDNNDYDDEDGDKWLLQKHMQCMFTLSAFPLIRNMNPC